VRVEWAADATETPSAACCIGIPAPEHILAKSGAVGQVVGLQTLKVDGFLHGLVDLETNVAYGFGTIVLVNIFSIFEFWVNLRNIVWKRLRRVKYFERDISKKRLEIVEPNCNGALFIVKVWNCLVFQDRFSVE